MKCAICGHDTEPRTHLFYRWGCEQEPERTFAGNWCSWCKCFAPLPSEDCVSIPAIGVGDAFRLGKNMTKRQP